MNSPRRFAAEAGGPYLRMLLNLRRLKLFLRARLEKSRESGIPHLGHKSEIPNGIQHIRIRRKSVYLQSVIRWILRKLIVVLIEGLSDPCEHLLCAFAFPQREPRSEFRVRR